MKVLVTGGAGFIGSHTVDLLLNKGYQVRVLDSLEPPVHPERRKPDFLPDDAEFICGDVTSGNDLKQALQGIDVVFHLAAYQGYRPDFSRFAIVNDSGTALLYQIIVGERLPVQKIILASSQAVYGEGKYQCLAHGFQYPAPRPLEQLEGGEWEVKCPICNGEIKPLPTDESKVNPYNQYAISKYCQELYALRLGRRFGIPTVALRYSIAQGARQSFHNAYSGILRIFTTRLWSGLPPVIYEDGRQLRDYIHVSDVARANLKAMESDAADYEVFNVGGEEAMTVLEYAELFGEVARKNAAPEVRGQFRFGDTRHVVSDISRLRKLGWRPELPVKQMIKDYLAWAETQPEVAGHYAVAEKTMKQEGIIRSVKR